MSHLKGNNDQTSKGQLYQTNSVSEKHIPSAKYDLTHILHLKEIINKFQVEELQNYIQKEKPSQIEIKTAINELLKIYESKNPNFYIMLDILLNTGFPINSGINFQFKELPKNFDFEENDEINLLMLGILLDDKDFVKTVLKYHDKKSINQKDKKGLNTIVYSILFNKNDNTDIFNLLLSNGADMNQAFKIQIMPNKYEEHSIFTLACSKNLPNLIKLLMDNPQTYINYKISPSGDTGLHICAKGGMENALKVLLSSDKINPDILNNEGKKASELIPDNEKKNEIMKLFVNYYNNNINKKNDMNANLSNMKSNNQYGSINNNVNKKNANIEQLNMNNINYENININNNKNDEYKNYINNNNLNIKNKMSNMSNNIEPNQLRQNMNIDNMPSNESSDFSEEQEIKEKINSNKNIKLQKVNNNITNPNQQFNQMNSIKLLNQNIYNNLLSNSNSNFNFNVEIPIKMMPRKRGHFQSEKFKSLNNFFMPKINSIPILNLDINDKTFQLELEINELTSQINELDKEIKDLDKKIDKKQETNEEKIQELKQKENSLNSLNNELTICKDKLSKAKEEQKENLNKFPEGKIYKESNKNGNKRELKFRFNEIEDSFMFKILNKDLLDYQLYITENIRRQNEALHIGNRINEIKNIIKNLFPDLDVQVYGSYAWGLNMEWSDIDLVITKSNENQDNDNNNNENILIMHQPNNNNEMQNDNISVAHSDSTMETLINQNNNPYPNPNPINNSILDILAQRIQQQLDWVKAIKSRENLEIKILRVECSVNIPGQMQPKRFDIDISVESEKHYGLKCVNLINSYLTEYHVLKPITIALRAILHSANLHLPDKGGLSAYGLILMVVSYIQSQKENLNKGEPDLCGKIFYGFLKHYGIIFDFNKYLILTYPTSENTSANIINMNQYGQEFIILDPLNNTNNVASKSFQFMNLKMAFMIAYMVTKEDCDCGCHFGEAEFENSLLSTEHCYLKRMLNSVRRFQG